MKKPTKVLDIFEKYTSKVDGEIRSLLESQNKLAMFDMMSYFFGYKDENFTPVNVYAGKRFRSGLCLLLAQMYGVSDKALEIASGIEIFHNFTLIHDDIEDNDPLRRGRATVWKLWGVNHGINTGDGQMILANLELLSGTKKHSLSNEIQVFLNQKFLEVIEGQFLDFTLTDLPVQDSFVTAENYLQMIEKKSSVLIGAATQAAGMVAECDSNEIENLWQYGLNLGFAYQICDDLVSIWADPEMTGKISANDLREKKKTLPIIYLYSRLEGDEKLEFEKLYNKKTDLSESEIKRVCELLEKVGAYDYTWKVMQEHVVKSNEAIEKLSISRENKDKLIEINKALLPNVKELCHAN